jgi:acetyl-CoA carboxylase biotin carboxylase subunit
VITKLFIANRGEIAVRVVRAARELGIRAVVGHSSADADSLAVRLADEAVEIGPPHPTKSYLNVDAVVAAARSVGADGLHPGYGFLAENAGFAEVVEGAGMAFVGPTPPTIRLMGDKAAARAAAERAGVPTVPGSEGVVPDLDTARRLAEKIGFPIMIKAAAGGGGRGIRVAENDAELRKLLPLAQAEARAAFGDPGVYLERFVRRAKHIEVQVLGDGTDAIHLFERECSLQRRRQKVIEEAPSPSLDAAARIALCEAAVRLAKSVGYRSAGTVEFLYDARSRQFFFIEMNTRIQVEHPVTEMITGVDLVREMLRIGRGEPLRLRQADIAPRGAAMEFRINAEDPDRNFAPSPGTIASVALPGGPGVRIDGLLFDGYRIPPFYDSLLAKLIVWDEDRAAVLARAARALGEFKVDGVPTTVALHRHLLGDAQFRTGDYDTGYLERRLAAQP